MTAEISSETLKSQMPSEKQFIMLIVYLLPHILNMSSTTNTFINARTSTLISRIYPSLDVPRGKWARSYGRLDRYKNAIKLNYTFHVSHSWRTWRVFNMHAAIDNDLAVIAFAWSVFPSLWNYILFVTYTKDYFCNSYY